MNGTTSLWVTTVFLFVVAFAKQSIASRDDYQRILQGVGGELASLNDGIPYWDETYEDVPNSHRQNFCGQYELVRTGVLDLKDALRGLEVSSLLVRGPFIRYSEETGIDPEYPGLIPHLLDLIADRAGFTWRNSFAFVARPHHYNMSWTEMLWWSVNAFDFSPSAWDHNLQRMEMGIAFTEPWYDGSFILVDKLEVEDDSDLSIFWNWSRPFEPMVWVLIVITAVMSAFVYQLIEHLQGERQDRPLCQWLMDNLYLSFLNLTQNFEYAPSTVPARIFAVSMTFWALIMSATYTANLANLFVVYNNPIPIVSTMEDVVAKRIPICTLESSNMDLLIKQWYSSAERRPKGDRLEMFKALQSGECDIVAVARDGWKSLQVQPIYNPDCNFQQVGPMVDEIKSGFAMKADVGYKCTSLLRDVIDLHFKELLHEGELQNAWEMYLSRIRGIDCNAAKPEAIGREQDGGGGRQKRNLRCAKAKNQNPHQRRLIAASKASVSSTLQQPENESSLTLEQMMGTFLMHYVVMMLAIIASVLAPYWTRLTSSWGWEQPEPVIVRSHGPIVGSPPTMDIESIRSRRRTIIQAYGSPIGKEKRMHINTFVMPEKAPLDIHDESNGDRFLDELSNSQLSNTEITGRLKSHATVFGPKSIDNLQEHFDSKFQQTADHFNQQIGERLDHLKESFDSKLRQTAEQLNQQMTEQLNQQIGTMVAILEEKQKEELGMISSILLGGQRQEGQVLSSSTKVPIHLHYPRRATNDVGSEKRDFGQYLRHKRNIND